MKILIVKIKDIPPLQLKEEHLAKIRKVAPEAEIVAVSQEEMGNHLKDATILVTFPWIIPDFSQAKNLKWVHSLSAGMEKILTPEFINSPILASNSSGVHGIPIAEHVIGMMLIFTRRFYITLRQQLEKKWQRLTNLTELRDKTILVIGFGHIGREVVRLAKSLGMHTLAIDKNLTQKPDFLDEFYLPQNLNEILARADFVVLCLPYTKETHHFLAKEQFGRMKKEAFLINIGRGGLVNEEELIEALNAGEIAGAGLDVTEEEPLPKESPLWELENVIITPHHSGWSEKYMDRAIDIFCQNLKAFLEDRPLPNLVDKSKGY